VFDVKEADNRSDRGHDEHSGGHQPARGKLRYVFLQIGSLANAGQNGHADVSHDKLCVRDLRSCARPI
jgi:hypothetical protein